ncbi:hypothetical protein C5167_050739 [Papaver somniferum]|uniref:Probable purine permease n=1 Tax=Papaver somniferum TaxID=3469 RepID=A0A4Y7KPJ1_PAPSO|nr:hypothetical protein C5167_050739 [Papaver somniferum]
MYCLGLSFLPVSTSALLISTQLISIAIKFTPYSINAVVLMTLSSILLGLRKSGDRPHGVTNSQYLLGFFISIAAAALAGVLFVATQVAYDKAKKAMTFSIVLQFQLCMSFFATVFCTIGTLVNKDFTLNQAMQREGRNFELGENTYYAALASNVVVWQLALLGRFRIILCTSSLFAGIMGATTIPVTQIAGVIAFHEKFPGEKGMSLALGLWGFISYFYGSYKLNKKQGRHPIRPNNSFEDTIMVIGCPFTSIYNFGTLSKVTGNYEVVDYISSAFRLTSPKPYAANKKDGKFVYGADFVVEGSTALDTYFTTNNSVSKQVDQFVTHLSSICSNRQECWKKLRHAVFLVEEFGSRDYFHAISEGIKVREVEEALVPKVVESIINSVTILIQAGARNVMKFQEKSPSSKVHSYRCLRSFNRLTDLHNNRLNQALMDLSSQHPRVQIVFADYYKAFIALLKSLRKTCGGSKCGDATAVCSDPKKYIHSDENHLTQEANKFMEEAIVTAGSESFTMQREGRNFELGEKTYYAVLASNVVVWQLELLGRFEIILCTSSLFARIMGATTIPVT